MNKELITQLEEVPFDLKMFVEILTTLQERVKEHVMNKDVAIENRWQALINYPDIPIDACYHNPDPINWNKVSLYDDFYADKYATCNVEDFINTCVENQEKWNLSDEDITEIKEYFCQRFIKGFINDW